MPAGSGIFPPWVDRTRPLIAVALVAVPLYVVANLYYFFSPLTTNIGYMPTQPVAFSHAQHAGDLGIDCRYCHNTIERAAWAAVPPTQTCMNCHAQIAPDSKKLDLVRESYASGAPIRWVKVHDLPEFAYFDHSAHVSRGVGCVSCHGRVDTMEQVRQVETLTMGWCLDCHRNPDPHLRPQQYITKMDWQPDDPVAIGRRIREDNKINPPTSCSTCHR